MQSQHNKIRLLLGGVLSALLMSVALVPAAQATRASAAIGYSAYKTDAAYGAAHIDVSDQGAGPATMGTIDVDNVASTRYKVKELTLTLGDELSPSFSVALQLGYSEMSPYYRQPGNDSHLTGHLVGVLAQWNPSIIAGHLNFRFDAAYRRHSLDGHTMVLFYNDAGKEHVCVSCNYTGSHSLQAKFNQRLKWYETTVRAGPVLRFGVIQVSGGAYWVDYNGDMSMTPQGTLAWTGTTHSINTIRGSFSQNKNHGGFVGVGIRVSNNGYIRLYKRTGAQDGLGITLSGGF